LHCELYAKDQKTVEAEVIAFLVYRSDQDGVKYPPELNRTA